MFQALKMENKGLGRRLLFYTIQLEQIQFKIMTVWAKSFKWDILTEEFKLHFVGNTYNAI